MSAAQRTYTDDSIVAAYPHLIRREGPTLFVHGERYTDEGDCRSGDCTRYRADGVWHDRYVGVEVGYYEGGGYLLLGPGESLPIMTRPIASPSGTRFFTGYHDDTSWTPYHGASVWDWHDYPRRLRTVDTHLVVFDSFTRWHGESCVEFRGARGGYGGGAMQPVRTYWLAEQDGDWRLVDERPQICG
jgi:hypothetical protein